MYVCCEWIWLKLNVYVNWIQIDQTTSGRDFNSSLSPLINNLTTARYTQALLSAPTHILILIPFNILKLLRNQITKTIQHYYWMTYTGTKAWLKEQMKTIKFLSYLGLSFIIKLVLAIIVARELWKCDCCNIQQFLQNTVDRHDLYEAGVIRTTCNHIWVFKVFFKIL